jgi:hypothetical protein
VPIATPSNIDYRSLIGEILAGGLKRCARSAATRRKSRGRATAATPPRRAGNGNGNGEAAPEKAAGEQDAAAARRRRPERTAAPAALVRSRDADARLRDLGFSIGRFPTGRATPSPTSRACGSGTPR